MHGISQAGESRGGESELLVNINIFEWSIETVVIGFAWWRSMTYAIQSEKTSFTIAHRLFVGRNERNKVGVRDYQRCMKLF